jgi:hypothetical protein
MVGGEAWGWLIIRGAVGGTRRTKGKGRVLGGCGVLLWLRFHVEMDEGRWWISQRLEPKRGEQREGVGARLGAAK